MKVSNYNFTGRKEIPKKFVKIIKQNIEDLAESELVLKLELEQGFLKTISNAQGIYIDALAGNFRARKELKKENVQNISFDISMARVEPRTFHLIVLDTEKENLKGKIIQSQFLRLNRKNEDGSNGDQSSGSRKKSFFDPVLADLGNVIWKLNWDTGDVVWEMNKKLRDMYSSDSSNPLFMATCIPQLIKEVFKAVSYTHLTLPTICSV